jgi:glycosyltransferase involved in cell wall biosynthesis
MSAQTHELTTRLAGMDARLQALEARLEHVDEFVSGDLRLILRGIAAQDVENRRRLWNARAHPDYEVPFTDPKPLVSVVIPTFDRISLLCERSLPSVLAQTYPRLEVIVVGDHASAELADAVAGLGDPRIRFHNLSQRLPPDPEPRKQWMAGSVVLARNEGLRLARGSWLKHFDDDDFLRPDAIETLLQAARDSHAEIVYGRFRWLRPGEEIECGEFPPRLGRFAFQTSIVHGGLRFFERELVAKAFDTPNDAFCMEAMLRAGARFHMIPSVVFDYYDSGRAG